MGRPEIDCTSLCEMINRSFVKYGDCRSQWWREGDTTRSMTYSELSFIVKDMTCGLMEMGLGKGDRAAIMSFNCPEWTWADFAILNAGGVTVTIYPTSSPHEMSYIINDSGAKILFVRNQDELNKALQNLEQMPTLEAIIVMDSSTKLPPNPKVIFLDTLRHQGCLYKASHPFAYEKRWRSVEIWDWSTIVYTSGTTGEAKGALHTHQSIMAAINRDEANLAISQYEISTDDVALSFLPLSHTYEREMGQFLGFNNGSCIAYCQKPSTIIEDMQIFKPTYFISVPRIFERIYMTLREFASQTPAGKALFEKAMDIGQKVVDARSNEFGSVNLGFDVDFVSELPADLQQEYRWADEMVFSKIRMILGGRFRIAYSASASLSADLCKAFLAMGIRINEGYGLTETCNSIIYNNIREIMPGSIGKVAVGVEARIADDGELLVRGDNIFSGYYNNPSATAEAFTENGFFKTGDIVTVSPEGFYRIVDRKKAIMVLDTGKKVPRAKVENNFSTSRYIEQICVIGDDRKFISALVVPKYAFFMMHYQENNIPYDEAQVVLQGEGSDCVCVQVGEDFVNQQLMFDLIEAEIEEQNKLLESYEQIKKYVILPRPFLIERGEITPTLKNKIKNITSNWKELIDKLYL